MATIRGSGFRRDGKSSSSGEEVNWQGNVRCHCGMIGVERTAWTDDNPGRRFIGCPRFKV